MVTTLDNAANLQAEAKRRHDDLLAGRVDDASEEQVFAEQYADLADAAEVEACWIQEALRRKAIVASGASKLIPGHEAIARLEARLHGLPA